MRLKKLTTLMQSDSLASGAFTKLANQRKMYKPENKIIITTVIIIIDSNNIIVIII